MPAQGSLFEGMTTVYRPPGTLKEAEAQLIERLCHQQGNPILSWVRGSLPIYTVLVTRTDKPIALCVAMLQINPGNQYRDGQVSVYANDKYVQYDLDKRALTVLLKRVRPELTHCVLEFVPLELQQYYVHSLQKISIKPYDKAEVVGDEIADAIFKSVMVG